MLSELLYSTGVSVCIVLLYNYAEGKRGDAPGTGWMAQVCPSSKVSIVSSHTFSDCYFFTRVDVIPFSLPLPSPPPPFLFSPPPPSFSPFLPASPTVSSTLRSLSNVYREQGQLETAEELEKLTKEKVRPLPPRWEPEGRWCTPRFPSPGAGPGPAGQSGPAAGGRGTEADTLTVQEPAGLLRDSLTAILS